MRRGRVRWWPLAVMALVLTIGASAQTAANTVSSSKMKLDTRAIGANDLKPTECAALTLTNHVTGSGTINGTTGNDLILGSSGVDTIDGVGGNDCLVGGGGNDSLAGSGGSDVCLGGPGTDTFKKCETQVQ
jgi:Ca2+-binding RTX toxin-like protein